MRVAIVDTYYPSVLAEHYGARPGLSEAGYEEQLASLLDRCFGTADAYSFHLRALGHEAVDLIANCGPLQERWAADRGLFAAERAVAGRLPGPAGRRAALHLQRRLLMAQLAEMKPDVVYLHNLIALARPQLDALRRQGLLVVGQIASPLPPRRFVEGFDLVISSFPHFVERLRASGVDSEYLPLAVDERVLDRLRASGVDPDAGGERPNDVVFVGGVHPNVHRAGTRLLEALCSRRRVDVWGYGAEALPAGSPILRHFHGEAYGLDMYAVLAQARIVVNRHIDVAEGASNNMRLYEATGAGALLLTEPGHNLAELFAPGDEVVTYTTVDELEAAIDGLLADDDRCRAVAAAGQRRTLTDHTFEQRIAQLAELLEPRLR